RRPPGARPVRGPRTFRGGGRASAPALGSNVLSRHAQRSEALAPSWREPIAHPHETERLNENQRGDVMGKAALITVMAFSVMGAVYAINGNMTRLTSEGHVADYQHEVLARSAAIAGQKRAEQ